MAYNGHPDQLYVEVAELDQLRGTHDAWCNRLEGHRADLLNTFKTDVAGPKIQQALTDAQTSGLDLGKLLNNLQEDLRTFAGSIAAEDTFG